MKRSISLDIFKIVLSILIIATHIQPLFETRNLFEWQIGAGIGRIAVPCFFIIGGLFLSSKIDNWKVVSKYLLHLIIVYIIWSIFYFQFYYTNTDRTTILVNLVLGYHHLWYLPSLLFAVFILYVTKKIIKKDIYLLILAISIYTIGNIAEILQFGFSCIPPEYLDVLRPHIYRNSLFIGFPLVTIGLLIKKREVQKKIKSWYLLGISIVFLAILLLESYSSFESRITREVHLSLLFFCPATIMLLLKYPFLVNKSIVTEYLGYIPNGVYYLHTFFIFKFYSDYNNIYNIPAVFTVSVLTTIVLVFINRRLPMRIFL